MDHEELTGLELQLQDRGHPGCLQGASARTAIHGQEAPHLGQCQVDSCPGQQLRMKENPDGPPEHPAVPHGLAAGWTSGPGQGAVLCTPEGIAAAEEVGEQDGEAVVHTEEMGDCGFHSQN